MKKKEEEKIKKIVIGISAVLVLLIIIILCSWYPKMHFSSNTISRIHTQDKILVLTFDDGPGEQTNDILDVLAEKNVTATFFLVGERLAWYPNETARIIVEGHSIGSHSQAHKFALFGGEKDFIIGVENIESFTKEQISYYRPPYGFRTIQVMKEAEKEKVMIILWDIMAKDYDGWNEERIAQYTLKRIRPGSIIVLHDGPEHREETTQALIKIIDGAREKGYHFVSLTTALEMDKGTEDS